MRRPGPKPRRHSNRGGSLDRDRVTLMQPVKRFTTAYDPAQDRVRIMLEQADASVHVLWLTRRLLVRLVPEIVKILTTLPKLRADASPGSNVEQGRSQMGAIGQIAPQAPVGYQEAETETLVSSMRARLTRQAVLIDFKDGEQTLQTLTFGETTLRQWLAVLHQNFHYAGWKDDIWPTWISVKAAQGEDGSIRLN